MTVTADVPVRFAFVGQAAFYSVVAAFIPISDRTLDELPLRPTPSALYILCVFLREMSEAQPTALAANDVRSAALSETAMDASVSRRSEVLAMFENFRQILDEHNDRYERLVKISRDLTIQSKRVIFLLHRVASGQTTPTAAASARDPPARPASALGQTSDADTNARGYHDQDCARDGDANVQVEDPARTAELNAAAQARQKFDDLKPLFGKIVAELEGQEADRYSRALLVRVSNCLFSLLHF